MLVSHSNLQTLSQNIRPYLHKADRAATNSLPDSTANMNQQLQRPELQLVERTTLIKNLIGFLEDITWIDVADQKTKDLLTDLIHIAKLYYNEEKEFADSLSIANQMSGKKKFTAFISGLEDLQETIQDVESAIITLPKLDGFKDTFDDLARL